jgi:hypothetical protein
MEQHTLLIAGADPDRRVFLAAQLDADGHTVWEAHEDHGANFNPVPGETDIEP